MAKNSTVMSGTPRQNSMKTMEEIFTSGRLDRRPKARRMTSGSDTTGEAGATVAAVAAGGPAADAGLRVGDVITGIDDAAVANSDALGTAVNAHKPGTKVTVSYERDGKSGTASVTLGTRPAGSTSSETATTAP